MLIEQFGLTDNLMLEAAIVGSVGRLIIEEIAPEARWTDLSVFERCVEMAAATVSENTFTARQRATSIRGRQAGRLKNSK